MSKTAARLALAFALVGWGLRRAVPSVGMAYKRNSWARELGTLTLVLGALWLALTIVTGVSYLSHGVDELKGAFQRVDQVVFGGWLLVLAWGAVQDSGGG